MLIKWQDTNYRDILSKMHDKIKMDGADQKFIFIQSNPSQKPLE